MPRILRRLSIREVASVDRGAGEEVKVLLMKRDTGADAPYDLTKLDGLDAATVAYLKREFSDKQREHLAGTGAAMAGGGYPIENVSDLENAVRAFGRAKNPEATKRHIIARARALDATDKLPDDWKIKKGIVAKVRDWIAKAVDFDTIQTANECVEYAQEMLEDCDEALCALRQSVCSIMGDEECTDKPAAIAETFAQFQAHLETLVPDGIDKAMRGAALTAAGYTVDAQGTIRKGQGSMTEEEKKKLADAEKEAGDTKKALDVAKRELAVLKMSDKHRGYMADANMSEDAKGKFSDMEPAERDAHMEKHPVKKVELPEEVRKALAEHDVMKADLAKLREERALEDVMKRVTVWGGTADMAKQIHAVAKVDAKAAEAIEKTLQANTAQLKEAGLFKEFGGSGGNGADASAYDQLVAKAAELRKADPKLTEAQAFAKVYADPANASIAKRERAENRPAA